VPHIAQRKIANGLGSHRKVQLTANADTEKSCAVLARTRVDQIARDTLQKFMDVMRKEGNAPDTMALERSVVSRICVENLVLHDLRRTGATRLALKTCHAFL